MSVLLPAFNAAETLDACLRSIRRQTFTDFECLVVDDGSTDDTVRIASRTAAIDSRFRLIRRPHRGIVESLNAGLDLVEGEFVARMDADDLMRRSRVAMQVKALEAQPGLWAVGGGVRLCPRRELQVRRRDYERWLNELATPALIRRDAYVECPVAHPTLMLRTAPLRTLRYRDTAWPEDYDLVLRALASGLEFGSVAARVLAWRDGPRRLSRVDARYGHDRFTACKAHYLARGFLATAQEYVLWGYGATGKALRRALLTLGKSPSHIVEVKASRVGQRIHGAEVVRPEALARLRGRPVVVSVAFAGPRAEIRDRLARMAFVELRDFVCAA
ncbi:MAG: glycosyltransferase [Vicinamibacterales bacterium]